MHGETKRNKNKKRKTQRAGELGSFLMCIHDFKLPGECPASERHKMCRMSFSTKLFASLQCNALNCNMGPVCILEVGISFIFPYFIIF